jgi:hypothetical protein
VRVTGTPTQRRWQDRFERVIGFAAPALNLVLGGGERLSRVISPGQADHYPIRPPGEAFELPTSRGELEGPGPGEPVE